MITDPGSAMPAAPARVEAPGSVARNLIGSHLGEGDLHPGSEVGIRYLCSPETAAASALSGVITDPRTLDIRYPRYAEPAEGRINTDMLVAPPWSGSSTELVKGPNIASLPDFDPLPDQLEGPVLLKVGDNLSTDDSPSPIPATTTRSSREQSSGCPNCADI
ncbi:MAG TPA: hypothetical protein VGL60_01635 [Acidimicrobiales bacterium]|jgi:hypothetical protein